MLGSRGLILGRLARQTFQTTSITSRTFTKTAVNHSGGPWSYRSVAPKSPFWARSLGEIVSGLCWWWIFWHLYHESEHITGEFPYPDPSKWTDEELGIPPDDLGLAERIQEIQE